MRKYGFILALTLTAALQSLTSCINEEHFTRATEFRNSEKWGKVVRKELNLKDFHSINTASNIDIVYTQDKDYSVTIEGNEKVIAMHKLSVSDNTLVSESEELNPINTPCIRVYVTAPTLQYVSLSGAGDFDIKGFAEFDDFMATVSGAGDIDINSLQCGALTLSISGAGDIDIDKLVCSSADIDISGAGDITLKDAVCEKDASMRISGAGDIDSDMKCANLQVVVSGAGDAKVKVKCGTADITASGMGDITLKGKAKNLKKKESGFSSIDTKGLAVEAIHLDR